ncbi:MAG: Fe-S cluster assembly protein SufD [Prevotellaceae bacterium]|jgi:Fe-S cluster assembly protein SufD|nr:Fe-S cluster assembly protein SufD [Prevotellaceae bacterium]
MNKNIDNKYVNLYINTLELLQDGAADFVNQARSEAIESFTILGIPDKKVEKYKYTNLKSAFEQDYETYFAPKTVNFQPVDIFKCNVPDLDTYKIYTLNGFYYGDKKLKNKNGIIWGSFAEASRKYPELVRQYYNKYADNANDGVTALNTAFAQDGVFIYFPKNAALEKPIQIINLLINSEDTFIQYRNLFVFDENAQAKVLICDHTLSAAKFLSNCVSEMAVGQLANVELVRMQNEHNRAVHVSSDYVVQQSQSVVNGHTITLHGGLVRNNINVRLEGEHCENHTYGLSLTDKKQHIDNYTFIDHVVPNCRSNELFKSVIDEQSVGVFNGRILVRQDAQKTQAFQQNNNLLLSYEAKMCTKPQLEIYADDVKCTHGATVGQLNEEALFYMRSRGIGEKEARMLQLFGFVYDVLQKLNLEILRERVADLVNKRLRGELTRCEGCDIQC